ncbi:two-partner secretion domain-containing protein [Ramlibacter montanisoli]|uniref:Filamentous hemagglutinin N-terminal domain-containing protein n=1 Tax=Ramlibacter montanisoli TaxID=2732512 RepID=A0A849K9C6_9BURK|nr:filamentous hemagglutinin N-terminal domain-containing protein [Ramlibacter montanisoli]NNU44928.1 filamentous hemagglutinin N-terminal domain-containing protein [Ramlibacter montanisoli]
MSRVPSRSTRGARAAAASPAVAGFRPASAALAVAAAFAAHTGNVQAQPVPIGAIHGTASFTRNGSNLLVTTTNGAGTSHSAIDWRSFSVPGGSVTHFQQPTAASTSINRVLGPDPSAIFGTLSSNGRLVLVNPAGITVGKGALVDTAAFTAMTLRMSDADALAGRIAGTGDGAGVLQVDGHVIARNGDVVLIGSKVQTGSDAVVQADGAVVLAAGQKAELTGRGLEGIHLEVQAGNEAVNLGTLQGDAVGIFANTLRHSGLVQAQAVTSEGGRVVLKATGGDAYVSGTIVAAGADGKGGSIDVLGQRVALEDGASLQANGALGGGQVRVGGDYQGQNPDVPNAQMAYVAANARIEADATGQGDGGRVIVWADDTTRMHGQISARGGASGGNGGFAEVSGKRYLEFTGRVDLRAPAGRAGTLLLDPGDVVIDNVGPTDASLSGSPLTGFVYGGSTGPTVIKETDLEAQLALSSVIVATDGSSGGKITLAGNAIVDWSTTNALGLQADNGVDLQGNINATAAGSAVSIQALGGNVTQASTSVVKVDNLLVNAPQGSITMDGANLVNRLAANTGGSMLFTNAQSVNIATVGTPYGAQRSGITATGDVRVRTTNAGNIAVAVPPPPPPSPTPAPVPAAISAQNVTLQAAGGIDLQGSVTATASTGGVLLQASGGTINQLAANSVITAQSLLATAATGANLTGANAVGTLAGSGGSGTFAFRNAQALSVGTVAVGAVTGTGVTAGSVSLASDASMLVTGGVDASSGLLKVQAQDLTVSGAGKLKSSGTGDVDILTNGLNFSGSTGVAVESVNARVVINPLTVNPTGPGVAIVGSGGVLLDGGFNLANTDLDRIQSKTLVIGNGALDMPIALIGNVSLLPTRVPELSLITGRDISQFSGTLSVAGVNLDGHTVFVGNAGNQVGTVSGRYDDTFDFHSDSNLSIGTVDGIAGVQVVSPTIAVPDVFISSLGTLTVNAKVTGGLVSLEGSTVQLAGGAQVVSTGGLGGVDIIATGAGTNNLSGGSLASDNFVQIEGDGTFVLGNVTAPFLSLVEGATAAPTVFQQGAGAIKASVFGSLDTDAGSSVQFLNAGNEIASLSLSATGDVKIASSITLDVGFASGTNVQLKGANVFVGVESAVTAVGNVDISGTGAGSTIDTTGGFISAGGNVGFTNAGDVVLGGVSTNTLSASIAGSLSQDPFTFPLPRCARRHHPQRRRLGRPGRQARTCDRFRGWWHHPGRRRRRRRGGPGLRRRHRTLVDRAGRGGRPRAVPRGARSHLAGGPRPDRECHRRRHRDPHQREQRGRAGHVHRLRHQPADERAAHLGVRHAQARRQRRHRLRNRHRRPVHRQHRQRADGCRVADLVRHAERHRRGHHGFDRGAAIRRWHRRHVHRELHADFAGKRLQPELQATKYELERQRDPALCRHDRPPAASAGPRAGHATAAAGGSHQPGDHLRHLVPAGSPGAAGGRSQGQGDRQGRHRHHRDRLQVAAAGRRARPVRVRSAAGPGA